MKIYLLMILLFQNCTSNCKAGCLLCQDSSCLYCDQKQNYFRVGQICTQKNLENCLHSENGESCDQCDTGYYTDYSTGKCRQVGDSDSVEKCKYYKLVKKCQECEQDYYLENDICVEVETKIPNCQKYSSKNQCEQCNNEMRLENNQCIDIPFENCMTVGDIKCKQCKAGYMLYNNAYLYNFNIWSSDKLKKMNIYDLKNDFYNICAKQNVDNCLEYENFFQCKNCNVGYFLNPNKKCQEIPEEKIDNCQEYLKQNFCRLCMEGFYLYDILDSDDNKIGKYCQQHTQQVLLCKQMSINQKDLCQECEEKYFLESNTCVQRLNIVDKCSKYYIEQDSCETCIEGYLTNSDNTICIKKIENCNNIEKTITELICTQCISQYFYKTSQKKCIAVIDLKLDETFDNCLYFIEEGDTPRCSQCQKNYYLDSRFACVANSTFTQNKIVCAQWSYSVKNKCQSCGYDEIELYTMNFCETVDLKYQDDNALYYQTRWEKDDNGNIIKTPMPSICKEQFYLRDVQISGSTKTVKKCYLITIQYCQDSLNGLECTKCQSTELENYFLSGPGNNNQCISSYNYVIRKCNQRNDIESFQWYSDFYKKNIFIYYNACHNCYSPYYPVYFKDAQFCIPKNKLLDNHKRINSANENYSMVLDNCKVYHVEENKCYECNSSEGVPLVLDSKDLCVEKCETGTTVITKQYPLQNNNSQRNFDSDRVQKFKCQDLKQINYCSRISAISDSESTGFVTFQDRCMECSYDTNSTERSLAQLDETIKGVYKYTDKFAYLPTKTTQDFKTKNLSFESPYETFISYSNCYLFSSEKSGSTFADEVSDYAFALETYSPTQPDYRQTSEIWQTCKAAGTPSNSKNYCIACKFGFYGYMLPLSDNNNLFMIPKCKLNESCEYGNYITGLTSEYVIVQIKDDDPTSAENQRILRKGYVNFWVSCHICKIDTSITDEVNFPKIPTFSTRKIGKSVKDGQNLISIHQKIDSGTTFALKDAEQNFYPTNFCTVPGFIKDKDDKYLSGGKPVNQNFPANCGVQHIIHDRPIKKFDSTLESNPYCVACKPGYKPVTTVLDALEYKLIVNCVKIDNCDQTKGYTTFNKCTQCNEGYALNSTDDECLQFNNKLCYKGSKTGDNESCLICEKGYVPDATQKYCNSVEIQNCLDQKIFTYGTSMQTSQQNPTPTNPVVMMSGIGCNECDLGYIAVRFKYEQKTCVKSTEIENRTEGFGINDCFIYSSHDKCSKCNVGFVIPTNDPSICILSSKIENCLEYKKVNTDYVCTKCIQKYLLDNQKCLDGNDYITNCLEFQYDETNNKNIKTQCELCDVGYVKINKDGKIQCYQIFNSITQCEKFEAIDNQKLRCKQCNQKYYPKYFDSSEVVLDDTINNNIQTQQTALTKENINTQIEIDKSYFSLKFCGKIPLINNCKTYQTDNKCEQCNDQYYLKKPDSNNSDRLTLCEQRKQTSYPNCKEIDLNNDSCQVCLDSYYVRKDQCNFKPSGVIGCVDYSDEQTCIKCKDNSFVLGNNCIKVQEENLIEKCAYYQSEKQCMECDPGYLLLENQCKAILISNCKVYETEKTCLICQPQYFLSEQKTCKPGEVSSCHIHATINTCQTCMNNYYVNTDKQCDFIQDEKQITNCIFYESETECMTCGNQTLLAKDKRSCLRLTQSTYPSYYSQMDQYCESYYFETNCRVCAAGYKFYEGKCTKCSENVQNCHFCDYYNDLVCHVCKTGFSQQGNQCVSDDNTNDNLNDDILVQKTWDYFSIEFLLKKSILILILVFQIILKNIILFNIFNYFFKIIKK